MVEGVIAVGHLIGGRWRLTGFLGQGAFGQVFKAKDESRVNLGDAAVKVLHPNTSPLERADFLGEVKKIAQMRHQNLVAYLDSGEYATADGSYHTYLVTELCEYSLADYLASRPDAVLSADQARELLADLASGLAYLHRQSLLHRDMKPANVLRAGSEWKLADFGLARDLSATGHYHRGDSVKGTPSYMAPELFESASSSAAADVYALGVTVHQALTGKVLHEGSNDVAFIVKLTTTAPTIDPSLPPDWYHAVQRMCDRNPADRPRAADLIGDVASGAHGASSAPSSTHASTRSTPPPSTPLHPPSQTPQPAVSAHQASSRGQATTGSYPTGPSSPGTGYSKGLLAALGAIAGAVVLAVFAFTLANRNDDEPSTAVSGVEVDASADSLSETTLGDDGPIASPPTTLPPTERVDRVILTREDRPTGFTWVEGEPNPAGTETCVGTENARAAYPGIASRISEFSGAAHVFLTAATVHDSVATAEQFMAYAEQVGTACDEVPLEPGDDLVVADIAPLDNVELSAAEEFSATTSTYRGGVSDGGQLYTIYARVGDLTVWSTGTDEATVIYHAQLMVSRATGGPAPDKVEPEGLISNAEGSDSATRVRSASNAVDLDPVLTQWFATHSNTDIDLLMLSACEALTSAQTPFEATQNLMTAMDGLATDLRGDLNNDTFGQLVGIGIIFYCPEEGQRLGLL